MRKLSSVLNMKHMQTRRKEIPDIVILYLKRLECNTFCGRTYLGNVQRDVIHLWDNTWGKIEGRSACERPPQFHYFKGTLSHWNSLLYCSDIGGQEIKICLLVEFWLFSRCFVFSKHAPAVIMKTRYFSQERVPLVNWYGFDWHVIRRWLQSASS